MSRVVLHSDANNFYASVECLYHPELRGNPVVVCGNTEDRHGIVLAKNDLAKACGVKTGDTIWSTKQLCPNVICIPPDFKKYLRFSNMLKDIYLDYTDKVESFGLDECWLDVSQSTDIFGSGKQIADEIRRRVQFELGITVSIGVSFNKIFAKLGSDIKKPNATTVIERDNFKEIVWKLPVEDLLYVGPSTKKKLISYGILTIGDLANTPTDFLKSKFGKSGLIIWQFANGYDNSPVSKYDSRSTIKSIGNSTTTSRDLTTDEDVRITMQVLAESVAARMREHNFVCTTVQISIRDKFLSSYVRQGQLEFPASNSEAIVCKSFELYRQNHDGTPIRSVGIRANKLMVDDYSQFSILPEKIRSDKIDKIERTVDTLRNRYGYFCVQRGILLSDRNLSRLDAKSENIIHPQSYF